MAATALRIGGRAVRPSLAAAAVQQNQPTTSRLFHSTEYLSVQQFMDPQDHLHNLHLPLSLEAREELQDLQIKLNSKAAATRSAEIQQIKEELYRMMSENRDKIGNQKGLIKHLSSHVEPKPEDPVWRFYRRAKWYHLVMMYSPAFLYGYMSMCDVPDGKKEMTPAEKNDFNKRMAALMPNVEL